MPLKAFNEALASASVPQETSKLSIHGYDRRIDGFVFQKLIFYKRPDPMFKKTGELEICINADYPFNKGFDIKIPKIVRRKVPLRDGKGFRIGSRRELVLYLPFEYFKFDTKQITDHQGWEVMHYTKYISQRHPELAFLDYKNRTITEDAGAKAEAARYFHRIEELQDEKRKLDHFIEVAQEHLEKFDPNGTLRKVFKETRKRMKED